jgi:uncharacterized protein (DUF488 family)
VTYVFTIGAFGWTEAAFFDALQAAQPGVFCDIRRRRGVRGAEYAFVNSRRLQERLAALGIGYVHRLDLAPTQHVRDVQAEADARLGIAKRARDQLSDAFVQAYTSECLAAFDADRFLGDLGRNGSICLFCVEREPAACHRSLVSNRLAESGAAVRHLRP